MTTEKIPNKLINETSPYLLQHAYNPINWYPWGKRLFGTQMRKINQFSSASDIAPVIGAMSWRMSHLRMKKSLKQ